MRKELKRNIQRQGALLEQRLRLLNTHKAKNQELSAILCKLNEEAAKTSPEKPELCSELERVPTQEDCEFIPIERAFRN